MIFAFRLLTLRLYARPRVNEPRGANQPKSYCPYDLAHHASPNPAQLRLYKSQSPIISSLEGDLELPLRLELPVGSHSTGRCLQFWILRKQLFSDGFG